MQTKLGCIILLYKFFIHERNNKLDEQNEVIRTMPFPLSFSEQISVTMAEKRVILVLLRPPTILAIINI